MTTEHLGSRIVLSSLTIFVLTLSQNAHADSRDALFGDDDDTPKAKTASKSVDGGSGLKGFVQFELARTIAEPEHWSKLRTRGELGTNGKLGNGMKWKATLRLDYDAVFEVNNYYPGAVARDQRATAMLRETYLDASAGDWDFRLGRQHVVWGEMVGLYFADVVSARDLREFILPEFEMQRTPQWAARAEYFKDDFHAELLWIPVATYDEIGKPGAEFYPNQPMLPGHAVEYRNEVKPARTLRNGNYGLRFSTLKNGWDLSAFYYRSMDIQQTFYREIVGATVFYEPRHDRISQLGGTLTKDLGSAVLKGEGVYTRGRKFGVLNPIDADGVTAQNTLDWALGLDFSLPADTRFNVQFYQRIFFDHDPNILSERRENGYSLYLNKRLGSKWEAQATLISSLNRTDGLFRPRIQWNFEKNWRLLAGFDFFKGPPLGMFGRYANRDRFYSEIRYSF